jgi:hypothetical protein
MRGSTRFSTDRWKESGRISARRTYLKVRDGGRIVLGAIIIAVAVSRDGRREIVGLGIGPSEAGRSGRSSSRVS